MACASTNTHFTRSGKGARASRGDGCEVQVFNEGSPPQKPFEVVGQLKQADTIGTGFTCGYEKQLRRLQDSACKLGADAVMDVKQVEAENFLMESTCHLLQGTAVIWAADDDAEEEKPKAKKKKKAPKHKTDED